MAIISIPSSIGGVSIPGAAVNGPLGALFGNKYNVNNLKYPRDLESATRGHVVKFSINEIQPIGYKENKEYSLSTAVSGVGNAIGNALQPVSDFLGTGKIGDGTTKINLSLEPEKKKLAATVSLYMPDTVSFTYEANYSDEKLTDVAKGALESLAGVFGKGAAKLVSGTLDSSAGKLLLKSQGLAVNPNQQLLFDGLNLRTYSLSFTFTPYSKQESDTVKEIIKTFKSYSRPRTVTGSGGMLFIPPATFDLDFLFNGIPNPYINKVAESVITNIDVNYAPEGWSTHSDGSPVQTQMTIQFKEIRLIDRDGATGVSKGY
jgi:hypothetical protein